MRRIGGPGHRPWLSIVRVLARSSVAAMLMLTMLRVATSAQGVGEPEPPIVGSWFVYLDGLEPSSSNPAHLVTIHADGTVRDEGPFGPGVGAWREDLDGSDELTLWYPRVGGDDVGSLMLRVRIVVPVGPRAFEGDYTLEFPFATESDAGVPVPPHAELGPARLVGYRLFVSPRSEPAGPWPPHPSPSP